MEETPFSNRTIDWGRMFALLRRHLPVLLASAAVFLVAGALLGLLLYPDRYRSEATVLLDPLPARKAAVSGSDLFRNQEALLKSRKMATKVLKSLKKGALEHPVESVDGLLAMLNVERVPDTDFMRVAVTGPTPKDARNLATAYLRIYRQESRNISTAPLAQELDRLEKQAAETRTALADLNGKILAYQEKHNVVDLHTHGRVLVEKLEDINSRYQEAAAAASERLAEVKRIQSQLKMDTATAIQSVASGQSRQIAGLQDELLDARRSYDVMALTYAPTNPDMVVLEKKIEVLERQITDQQIQAIGYTPETRQTVMIQDPVRSDLVRRLALGDAEYHALKRRMDTLAEQENRLQAQLSTLPDHQLTYARMILEKKNLEERLTRLESKLDAVHIREAGLGSVVQLIDEPGAGVPMFPSAYHVMILAGLLGLALSAAGVVGYYGFVEQNLGNAQARPDFVENTLEAPLLSVIPWVGEKTWHRLREQNILEMIATPPHEPTITAYQTLALGLKVNGSDHGRRSLVIASCRRAAEQPVIMANLAYCLAQSGDRVVLVDTCLRNPRLHGVFGHMLQYDTGITEIINSLSEVLYKKPDASPAELYPVVQSGLIATDLHTNICYVNAGVAMDAPFGFLNSRGFMALAGTLRHYFDWVLFDAPPMLNGPDTSVILKAADGLVLLVEYDASESHIRQVRQRILQVHGNTIGTVMRENLT